MPPKTQSDSPPYVLLVYFKYTPEFPHYSEKRPPKSVRIPNQREENWITYYVDVYITVAERPNIAVGMTIVTAQ